MILCNLVLESRCNFNLHWPTQLRIKCKKLVKFKNLVLMDGVIDNFFQNWNYLHHISSSRTVMVKICQFYSAYLTQSIYFVCTQSTVVYWDEHADNCWCQWWSRSSGSSKSLEHSSARASAVVLTIGLYIACELYIALEAYISHKPFKLVETEQQIK